MQAWEHARDGRQLSPSSRAPQGPRTHGLTPPRTRSTVPAGRLQQKQSSGKAPPTVAARPSSDGAVRARRRQHDTRRSHTGLTDTQPLARPPWAAAKSPLGAAKRSCRESSYELNMWKKNLAFMQRSLSMWQRRAVSPHGDTKTGDNTGDDCDTQPTRRHPFSSASARVSPPPKSPEQDFADALANKLTALLRRDEASARQRSLRRRSVELQPPRLEPPGNILSKRPDDWNLNSVCTVDLACGSSPFAVHMALVLAAFVLAVLFAVVCTVSREPEDSFGVCCS